jgi:hypothetical protein
VKRLSKFSIGVECKKNGNEALEFDYSQVLDALFGNSSF